MLQIFRDKAQSKFIQGVVVTIALVFVFWGVGSNNNNKRSAAIIVNEEEISFQEYDKTYNSIWEEYKTQLGGNIPKELLNMLDIQQQAINRLSQDTLLRQGSMEMGITTSSTETQDYIKQMAQFIGENGFNLNQYKAVLSAKRLSPKKFEESIQYDLLKEKAVNHIATFIPIVNDFEIDNLYQFENEQRSFDYISLSNKHFIQEIKPKHDEIETWFTLHKDNYKTAPELKLQYLFFSFTDENTKSLSFQAVITAYENIIASGSLSNFAKKYPNTNIIKTNFFPQANPPVELTENNKFLNKAFALKEGELSSIVETPTGYAIIFAEQIKQPEIPLLSEVFSSVKTDYIADIATKKAEQAAKNILIKLKDGNSFQSAITKIKGLNLQHSGMFSRNQIPVKNIPESLTEVALELSQQSNLPGEIIANDKIFYVLQLTKHEPAQIPETNDYKDDYKKLLLEIKKNQLLNAWIAHENNKADITIHKNIAN